MYTSHWPAHGYNYHCKQCCKQQQLAKGSSSKKVDYQLLDDMLETIKIAVESQKSNFAKYVKAATKQGLKLKEIWKLARGARS